MSVLYSVEDEQDRNAVSTELPEHVPHTAGSSNLAARQGPAFVAQNVQAMGYWGSGGAPSTQAVGYWGDGGAQNMQPVGPWGTGGAGPALVGGKGSPMMGYHGWQGKGDVRQFQGAYYS